MLLSESAQKAQINKNLADNETEDITPGKLREPLLNMTEAIHVAPNKRKAGPFYVRWRDAANKVDAQDTALSDIPPEALCLNARAFVEIGFDAGEYRLVWDKGQGTGIEVYRDGSFTQKIGGVWVPADSDEAAEAAVEFFNAQKAGGYYGPDDPDRPQSVVRYTLNGSTIFQRARQRLATLPIPAPTGLADDPNWQSTTPPAPPATGEGPSSTDQLSEGSTNQYFTAARVLATKLAGYAKAATAAALAPADTVLSALAKLEKLLDGKANSTHSHNAATQAAAGFMSADDKKKLDGLGSTTGGAAVDAYTKAESEERYGVNLLTGGLVSFTKSGEYAPISQGTFSLDTTGAKTGVVVFVYLTPTANMPTIPASFQLIDGLYEAGKLLMYAFKVGANGRIQYTISTLPE